MWFDEPHPFPERGSRTILSGSGQQRYEGWSCININPRPVVASLRWSTKLPNKYFCSNVLIIYLLVEYPLQIHRHFDSAHSNIRDKSSFSTARVWDHVWGPQKPKFRGYRAVFLRGDTSITMWGWPLYLIQCWDKNEWGCTFTPPICLYGMHGYNFTF